MLRSVFKRKLSLLNSDGFMANMHWHDYTTEFSNIHLNLASVIHTKHGSSQYQAFYKIEVLKDFVKFVVKHLRQSLVFIKLQSFREKLQHRCFTREFCKFFNTIFFREHFRMIASEKKIPI